MQTCLPLHPVMIIELQQVVAPLYLLDFSQSEVFLIDQCYSFAEVRLDLADRLARTDGKDIGAEGREKRKNTVRG